jgi:hypothetical protein
MNENSPLKCIRKTIVLKFKCHDHITGGGSHPKFLDGHSLIPKVFIYNFSPKTPQNTPFQNQAIHFKFQIFLLNPFVGSLN